MRQWLAFFGRHGKTVALTAGFLFSTMGVLWALLVTERLSNRIQQLADIKTVNSTSVDRLNRLSSEYFIANQQSDLIFVLAAQADADQDLIENLIKGNLLDRATPVQNMLAELELEKQLDYAAEMRTYTQLNDAANANLTPANFKAVKAKEKDIVMRGQARVPVLLQENADIDRSLNAMQARQTRNRLLGVTMAIAGSAVLLGANLMTERAASLKAVPAGPTGDGAADAALPPEPAGNAAESTQS